MTIRSVLKKLDRPGVQGSVSFDPTLPNANVPLFTEIKKIISGDLGIGGAGGELASKLQTGKSFQASHVFQNAEERDKVTERLNSQLTEFLQARMGAEAEKQGKSIPDYLKDQGIHGISQIGAGKEAKLSAYKQDDFVKAALNPVTSSNERLAKAYLKKIGAQTETFGGSNEERKLSFYGRPEEVDFVNKKTKETTKKLNAGLGNLGDMEGIYASKSQREEIKAKQKTSKNERAAKLMKGSESPIAEEVRSDILRQEQRKKIYAQEYAGMVERGEIEGPPPPAAPVAVDEREETRAGLLKSFRKKQLTAEVTQEMIGKGELPAPPAPVNKAEEMRAKLLKSYETQQLEKSVRKDMIKNGELPDDEDGKKKKTPAKVAAQAMLVVINTMKEIKAVVSGLFGVLQQIAMDMGRILATKAATGVDAKKLEELHQWGVVNPTQSGGNDFILVDSVSETTGMFGNVIRMADTMGSVGKSQDIDRYADIQDVLVAGGTESQDPFATFSQFVGKAAGHVANAGSKKEQHAELTRIIKYAQDFKIAGPAMISGMSAVVQKGIIKGTLTPKNAEHFLDEEVAGSKKVGVAKEVDWSLLGKGAADGSSQSFEQKIAKLNDVVGTINGALYRLRMVLLENIPLIESALKSFARGIVDLLALTGNVEAQKTQKQMDKADAIAVAKVQKVMGKLLPGAEEISKQSTKTIVNKENKTALGKFVAEGFVETDTSLEGLSNTDYSKFTVEGQKERIKIITANIIKDFAKGNNKEQLKNVDPSGGVKTVEAIFGTEAFDAAIKLHYLKSTTPEKDEKTIEEAKKEFIEGIVGKKTGANTIDDKLKDLASNVSKGVSGTGGKLNDGTLLSFSEISRYADLNTVGNSRKNIKDLSTSDASQVAAGAQKNNITNTINLTLDGKQVVSKTTDRDAELYMTIKT